MVDMAKVHGLERARKIVKGLYEHNRENIARAKKDLNAAFYSRYANGVYENKRELDELESADFALSLAIDEIDKEIEKEMSVDKDVV